MVNAFTMKVRDPSNARQLLQFFNGANADDLNRRRLELVTHTTSMGYLLHIFADPEGDGRSPITVP